MNDLKQWAKEWNEFVQIIGIIIGLVIATLGVGFAIQQLVIANQQLETANNQLKASTPLVTHFNGTWRGGQQLLSWQYGMIPYRTGTVYLAGSSNDFPSCLRNAPQAEVVEDRFGTAGASTSIIVAMEQPFFVTGEAAYHSCSFPFLPMRITDPGININIQVTCVYANATCGRVDFTGELVFYP